MTAESLWWLLQVIVRKWTTSSALILASEAASTISWILRIIRPISCIRLCRSSPRKRSISSLSRLRLWQRRWSQNFTSRVTRILPMVVRCVHSLIRSVRNRLNVYRVRTSRRWAMNSWWPLRTKTYHMRHQRLLTTQSVWRNSMA